LIVRWAPKMLATTGPTDRRSWSIIATRLREGEERILAVGIATSTPGLPASSWREPFDAADQSEWDHRRLRRLLSESRCGRCSTTLLIPWERGFLYGDVKMGNER